MVVKYCLSNNSILYIQPTNTYEGHFSNNRYMKTKNGIATPSNFLQNTSATSTPYCEQMPVLTNSQQRQTPLPSKKGSTSTAEKVWVFFLLTSKYDKLNLLLEFNRKEVTCSEIKYLNYWLEYSLPVTLTMTCDILQFQKVNICHQTNYNFILQEYYDRLIFSYQQTFWSKLNSGALLF